MSDFNSTKEMMEWLLIDNNKVQGKISKNVFGFCFGELYNYTEEREIVTIREGFVNFSNAIKYIELKWYESIPEKGRLCWVWDISEKLKEARVVLDYSYGYYYTSNTNPWKNAEPLTDDEIRSFLQDSKQGPQESD